MSKLFDRQSPFLPYDEGRKGRDIMEIGAKLRQARMAAGLIKGKPPVSGGFPLLSFKFHHLRAEDGGTWNDGGVFRRKR